MADRRAPRPSLDFGNTIDGARCVWSLQSDGRYQTWVCGLGWVYGREDSWSYGLHAHAASGVAPDLATAMRFFDEKVDAYLKDLMQRSLVK